jgi:biopolymer transport protein ExbD
MAELNLVPFIDFLSALVAFLMLTAVWSQLQAVELEQGRVESIGPPVARTTLALSARGAEVIAPDGTVQPFARVGDTLDWPGITTALRATTTPVLRIRVDDDVVYDEFVASLDHASQAGYPNPEISGS